jgi:hypothetical protein
MPKGVYPRRRPGRPAKTAPKPEPKSLSIREQYRSFWDFYNADPEYKRINEEITQLRQGRASFERGVTDKTHQIQGLLIARDLVLQGSVQAEEPAFSDEEVLKLCTGNDSEMWSGMLFEAFNELTGVITDKCVAIAELAKQRDEKDLEIKERIEELNSRREILSEQWDAAEELKKVDG